MQQNNGLDKNQLISFAVFSMILIGFMFYFQNRNAKAEQEQLAAQAKKTEQTAKAKVSATNLNATAVTPTSVQKVNLQNDELALEFSSVGGQLSSVKLNKFEAFGGKPLYLFNNNNSNYGFQFTDKSGKVFNTKELVFAPQVSGNSVTLSSKVGNAVVQFIYTLKPKYTLDFQVKTQGLANIVNDGKANFVWNYNVRGAEKGRSQEETHTEFAYAFNNYKDYDYDARSDMDEPDETLNWIGVKQQFFAAVIEAKNGFTKSKGNQEAIPEGEFLKKFNYDGQVNLAGNELNQDFTWYFMPLDMDLLKSYDKNFDEI
ncbi:MAG: membrane protein insertase YidC, partial [Chryseobacterium sp.]|nr:membrane protein insertase YidC [Chryseobacterium sp.]